MAVYADKRGGEFTGRWRVELQRGKDRYRQRHDSHQAALEDEKRVKALWDQGDVVGVPAAPVAARAGVTIQEAIDLAQGQLWSGKSTEDTAWAHIGAVRDILGKDTLLDAIDAISVDRIIQVLAKRGKADGTINRYLSHLRTFLSWTARRKYRSTKPEEGMFAWRKESPGRIRWITPEEEAAAYAYLESRPAKWSQEALAIRDLIEIAIETGCRRDELLTTELGQINGTRLHLWETKTDTPRTVPMTQRIADKLVALIVQKRMPTKRGLRSWWQRVRDHLGLLEDKDFVFHACRHTRATRMLDAGINLLVIKEWMGHKRLETTLRYAHVKPQNLEDALVRVGEYTTTGAGKPQNSAANDAPPTIPHAGGMNEIAVAA